MKTTVEYKINSRVFNEKRRFYGTVKKARNVYTGEFLDIVIRQGSTLTKGDLKVSFEMIMQALITEMLKGNKVFLPIGVFSLGMEGSFESFSDMFTEGRHKFVAKLAASKDMKALLERPGIGRKVYRRGYGGDSQVRNMRDLQSRGPGDHVGFGAFYQR